jgi:hypothetical protein
MAKQQNTKVDSISNEQNARYQKRGITYVSNIPTVNVRDEAGNILFTEGKNSQPVIIEPITTRITTTSVLKILDTQFNYFKFPARTTTVDESLDLDLDLNLDLELELEDTAAAIESNSPSTPARYKPSANQQVVKANADTSQPIDLSVVTVGPAQTNKNSFTIAQDLIDSGKSLKVTGVITTQYNDNSSSEVGFLISYTKPDGVTNKFTNAGQPGNNGTLYPNGINNNKKVSDEGIYETIIDYTIAAKSILDIGEGGQIFISGFAEDQKEKKNHTILANSTYVKFEAV